jgi:outer membrane protein TolC
LPLTDSKPIVAALLAATALAGCKTVGPNFQSPAPPATPGYLMQGDAPNNVARLSPDARVAGAWWKSFGSAELDRVMDQALAGNQTVAAADASLERLRQEAAATRGAQQPQVGVNTGAEGERINIASLGFAGFPNPTLGLYSIGGTVSYDADLFGGLRRNSEAAAAKAESQARQADAAYLTLTGQTTMAALQIATVRAQIVTVQQSIDEDEHVVRLIREAEGAGGEAPSASVSARAQLAADHALLPPPTGARRTSISPASPRRRRSRSACRRAWCAAAPTSSRRRPTCTSRPPSSASPPRRSILTCG